MTALTLPTPATLDPRPCDADPQCACGAGDRRGHVHLPAPQTAASVPAPTSTMLAVLGRIASHAGEPLSVSTIGASHTIVVTVAEADAYAAWCREAELPSGALVRADQLGSLTSARSCLHGWSITVQLAA